MTKKADIPLLQLDELRPLVQRALQLAEWPGDWPAAGLIIENHVVYISSSHLIHPEYSVTIRGFAHEQAWTSAEGNSTGPEALTAIYRAYILMRWQEAEWDKKQIR